MINTSQLQIGSWVRHSGGGNELWQIDISLLTDIVDGLIQVEGEPLTTDWLERAGYVELFRNFWGNENTWIESSENGYLVWLVNEGVFGRVEYIVTYLHELQLLMAGLGRPITFDGK